MDALLTHTKISHNICSGKFDIIDVALLLVLVRPKSTYYPLIKDISNFVTHYDGRDQGDTFESILKYINRWIDVSTNRGTIDGFLPIFTKEMVITELISAWTDLYPQIDETRILTQKDKIFRHILEIMDRTKFQFRHNDKRKDARIIKWNTILLNNKIYIDFSLTLSGPFIKTGPGMTMRIQLSD